MVPSCVSTNHRSAAFSSPCNPLGSYEGVYRFRYTVPCPDRIRTRQTSGKRMYARNSSHDCISDPIQAHTPVRSISGQHGQCETACSVRDEALILEIARRGGWPPYADSLQRITDGIRAGRGTFYLRLTDAQHKRLQSTLQVAAAAADHLAS